MERVEISGRELVDVITALYAVLEAQDAPKTHAAVALTIMLEELKAEGVEVKAIGRRPDYVH